PQQRPRSLWDRLPIEIKSKIISRCDPVTRYLNQDLTNADEIESLGEQMWKIVLEQDVVDFNLTILPQSQFPTIKDGLDLVKSEQMYQNLGNLKPHLTNTAELKRYLQNDATWTRIAIRYAQLSALSSLLIHIPLRNLWWNHIPDWLLKMRPVRVFAVACWFGHLDLAKYLVERASEIDMKQFITDVRCDCLYEASSNGDVDIVNLLISLSSSDIDCSKYRALEKACNYGRTDVVKVLVNLFDPIILEELLLDIFLEACFGENTVAVGMLAKHFGHKMSPQWMFEGLVKATENGYPEIVRILLSTSEPSSRSGLCEDVLFEVVVPHRHITMEGVAVLLEFCDITSVKESATRKGYSEFVDYLNDLEAGNDTIILDFSFSEDEEEDESERGSVEESDEESEEDSDQDYHEQSDEDSTELFHDGGDEVSHK
ncbi:hypothetical protein HDU76_003222, partial [Blyttiomyces sp. JEL0837]